jgi:hypothetical protein
MLGCGMTNPVPKHSKGKHAPLRPQPDARAIVEPQPSTFWLLGRYFKPLTPPDALHPLGNEPPACGAQQRSDAELDRIAGLGQ